MKTKLTDFILTGFLLTILGFQNCGYKEEGHANTPPAYPGTQTRPGADTVAHPANIDKDTITVH